MKEKIKCLIVDDEELARLLLQNYVERIPFLEIVGLCANPIEAFNFIQTQKVDLLFLDIQMPEMTGIELLNSLVNKPMVIFTTAYKEYALQGFELNIVDYLLKPFRFERFMKAVNKCIVVFQNSQELEASIPKFLSLEETEEPKTYVLVKSEFKIFRVPYDDILYIQSMSEYVAFYTKEKRMLSLGSLKELVIKLPQKKFVRIHKSYIVNLDKIECFEGNMIHVADKKLPIGASYKADLMNRIF